MLQDRTSCSPNIDKNLPYHSAIQESVTDRPCLAQERLLQFGIQILDELCLPNNANHACK